MTDDRRSTTSNYTDDDPLVLPARLVRREKYTPWWSGLLGPIRAFISMLPSHKSTRKGRRSARQFRLVAGGIIFAGIIFSPEVWITLAAILLFLLVVPWLPLPEVRKRAWTNRLASLQKDRHHTVTRPARIVYDGRRVMLDKGGNTLRRVLTDRREHKYRVGLVGERVYLKLAPLSGRKSDTIWVGTDDLEADDIEGWDRREFDPDEVDRPALVTDDDWRKLRALLASLED